MWTVDANTNAHACYSKGLDRKFQKPRPHAPLWGRIPQQLNPKPLCSPPQRFHIQKPSESWPAPLPERRGALSHPAPGSLVTLRVASLITWELLSLHGRGKELLYQPGCSKALPGREAPCQTPHVFCSMSCPGSPEPRTGQGDGGDGGVVHGHGDTLLTCTQPQNGLPSWSTQTWEE